MLFQRAPRRIQASEGERAVLLDVGYAIPDRILGELIRAIPDTLWEPAEGPNLHHLGYAVDEVAPAAEALNARGCRQVYRNPTPGRATYHRLPSGMLIEIVSRRRVAEIEAAVSALRVP
jgi:hypothetical protein